MAILNWDAEGERLYQTGVDHGVLYPKDSTTKTYPQGYVWNGLTTVTASPSGAEVSDTYADNIKYLSLLSAEDFGLTIEALMYPDEFEPCLGHTVVNGVVVSQQKRHRFGFSYRTLIGNDVDGTDYGYKLHLVYNCLAGVSEEAAATVNDSPEAPTMSWEISTTPVVIALTDSNGKKIYKPTAHIEIDSTKADATKLKLLEDALYGTDTTEAHLPSIDEVITMLTP